MEKEIIAKVKNNEDLRNYFVQLSGSEKQIKWADEIRRDCLKIEIETLKEDLFEGDEEDINFTVKQIKEILTEKYASVIISWEVQQ
jgi:hypothetical protein